MGAACGQKDPFFNLALPASLVRWKRGAYLAAPSALLPPQAPSPLGRDAVGVQPHVLHGPHLPSPQVVVAACGVSPKNPQGKGTAMARENFCP